MGEYHESHVVPVDDQQQLQQKVLVGENVTLGVICRAPVSEEGNEIILEINYGIFFLSLQ